MPRFQLLQQWQKRPTAPLCFYLFDPLWNDGSDLTGKTVVVCEVAFAEPTEDDQIRQTTDPVACCAVGLRTEKDVLKPNRAISLLVIVRLGKQALRFGRLYFRQVSGNGRDFGYSSATGGLVAFSRVISEVEVLVVANTNTQATFDGLVLQDPDLNRPQRRMVVAHSNLGGTGSAAVRQISDARFFRAEEFAGVGDASALPVGANGG